MSDSPQPTVSKEFRRQQLSLLRDNFSAQWLQEFTKRCSTPALIFDSRRVAEQYEALQWHMPHVKHHYALKALPLSEIIQEIKNHDGYVDVASKREVDMALAQGIQGPRLIYTNPHKKPGTIQYAISKGVTKFVVDNKKEVEKFIPHRKEVELIIRLSFPNQDAVVDLSYKFGIAPDKAIELLGYILALDLRTETVSFHVGSQLDKTDMFEKAIKSTREFFDLAKSRYNHHFKTLDIGGGFPTPYTKQVHTIESFAEIINNHTERLFPTTEIISEPGRFVVNSCLTNVARVVGVSHRHGQRWVFIDDGVYGSYSGILFDFSSYVIYGMSELESDKQLSSAILGGPTCDSHDIIAKDMPLPDDLAIGDYLISPNMGAYSWTHSTEFNSLPRPTVYNRNFERIA